ncbi:MAG TPA: hypothetical protein PKV16_03155 [Caldisericia bacterium]|nr:hypothetical protein [Caldisericia bacterium]HPF48309.1 hypothetical protein [Caldisericia bacterium]HPI83512.1 hypothetical protein [Caldisericia bacterium]HPQ92762.1 hypothetical protein [Caldisericia bacterium]HRV74140.1 hypothetical protein [Caldisericia bacterium]
MRKLLQVALVVFALGMLSACGEIEIDTSDWQRHKGEFFEVSLPPGNSPVEIDDKTISLVDSNYHLSINIYSLKDSVIGDTDSILYVFEESREKLNDYNIEQTQNENGNMLKIQAVIDGSTLVSNVYPQDGYIISVGVDSRGIPDENYDELKKILESFRITQNNYYSFNYSRELNGMIDNEYFRISHPSDFKVDNTTAQWALTREDMRISISFMKSPNSKIGKTAHILDYLESTDFEGIKNHEEIKNKSGLWLMLEYKDDPYAVKAATILPQDGFEVEIELQGSYSNLDKQMLLEMIDSFELTGNPMELIN